ncbi:hypothetical protein [Devosia sp.]|uniref:hypothetical protein n=1 Tax=Devosia sp. TaxID=1871048 RepID=UPI001B179CC2|nr:hypothetical protein [Devosia sp.]MBO9589057.1 hypothetical protein [Devosia sp.]
MVGRVATGFRLGAYGIWVSKPGIEVLTAGDADLLLSSDRKSAQVVASGIIAAATNGTYVISWPSTGFTPVVVAGSARFPEARAVVTGVNTANILAGIAQGFSSWTGGNTPISPFTISWIVLNIPG